jgi:hypothetical protein
MKSINFFSILFTALFCFVLTTNVAAQKTAKPKTKNNPSKELATDKVAPAEDCIAASPEQETMLMKACEDLRFAATPGVKLEKATQERVEKIKKIVSGDATTVCKLYEKVKKSKKVCGDEKAMLTKFAAVYEM